MPIAEPIRVSLLCDPRTPSSARIDQGEAEAIIQASERSAVDVLIDERRARRIAEGHSLNVCGLLGLLKDFKRNALIKQVGPLIAKLKNDLDYRINTNLLIRELAELGEVWADE
jgi:predicted nucleic acid-binding protein